MNSSVYKISLDIHTPESQETLEMKHLDSKRKIHISLTENGKVYQITPDCKAMFSAEKSDSNKIYNQCEIVDNTIIYDVTQQTLACVGEVDCEVQLLGSGEAVITSPRFSIIVHDRVYNGEDIVDSETETDVLPDLIAKSHEHDNKEVLDGITQELLDQIGTGGNTGGSLTPEQAADLEANTAARHEHQNKEFLDSLTPHTYVKADDYSNDTSAIDARISNNTMLAESALKIRTENSEDTQTLAPDRYYDFGEAESLTLDFEINDELSVYRNEYSFTFISGITPTVLTLPDTVKWANELTIEANKRYEISIVDNIGLWCAIEVSV